MFKIIKKGLLIINSSSVMLSPGDRRKKTLPKYLLSIEETN